MLNILFGLLIEGMLLLGHHWAPLVQIQDLAFDRMVRVNAVLDPAPRAGVAPPRQTFVDIDEASWRDASWGGGEPALAPRDRLLALLEQAYAQGASEVVLDVAVEGSGADDALFARGIESMLKDGRIGARQSLVLVRSLRPPLAAALAATDAAAAAPSAAGHAAALRYLNEMRAAPAIDSLLARADPRLVVAAPYFSYSDDRVLRDWALFSVLCQRIREHGEHGEGTVQILPSVQLAVTAHRRGVDIHHLDWRRQAGSGACVPFPASGTVAGQAHDEHDAAQQNHAAQQTASAAYWDALQASALRHGEQAEHGGVGNRVVFRSAYPFERSDPYFERMPAAVLLASRSAQVLAGRVVVIGQSHRESADSYFTPLGTMPGSVVLINAIDSMARYDNMEAVSRPFSMALALLSIVLVGYVYARWDSLVGTIISTTLILLLFAVGSVYLFRSGLWLDFALPLVGIQIHRMIRSAEEYFERRQHDHGHE